MMAAGSCLLCIRCSGMNVTSDVHIGIDRLGLRTLISGLRVRRERPREEWTATECPALVEPDIWSKVQVRMKERATGGKRGGGVRRYLLSGLLLCERCGGQFVATGKNGSHYSCSTHSQGGESACSVAGCISRALAESLVLEPIKRELLSPEAVEARPARAQTLRPLVHELRERQSKLQRDVRREANAKLVAQIPAEEEYRAAVAEMGEVLQAANIEAARAALRSLIGHCFSRVTRRLLVEW